MTGGDASARWARVCAVLDAVLDAPREERTRIIDRCCGEDPSLRAEVEALLRAETLADARLESPVPDWAAALVDDATATDTSADRLAGTLAGPWRLVEEIGRGGMGTVWLAERAVGDFEQRVALKLLKRGVDSDAILARFVAERRILARLEHPHIARLVDGGVGDAGRPWFAMELVDGEPITRWCDARRLPVHDRVRLFLAVIDAVQHAHQQLVVHRDLKPSNILVARTGEVKLLDFGIAKLLDAQDERAGSETLTRLGWRMLTPEYAAPEQLRGEAVTTATDVYALGVLLYELLAGTRPPRARGDGDTGAATNDRLVPRPSTHCAADAAETRATTPMRLARSLRGDLDTIVLRALHPEPGRRYGTAQALGEDLRRHLDGLPVRARPDSAWYRARRFAARNRAAVAAAALITLSLAGGLLATAWQAREARLRAQEAEQQARRAERVQAFLIEIFEAGGPQEWRGEEATARELLDAGARRVDEELAAEPALHAEMLAVIGTLHMEQGQLDRAETLLRRSLEERRRLPGPDGAATADSLVRMSALLEAKGDWTGAEAAASRAVAILRGLGDHPRTADALGALSDARFSLGDMDGAIELRRQALGMVRRAHRGPHADVADNLRALGAMLVERERYDDAGRAFQESLDIDKRLYGVRSVRYASGLDTQANLLYRQGNTARAAAAYRQAADIYRRAGDVANHEDALNHYGIALCRLGRFDDAVARLRESLELVERNQPAGSQWIGIRSVSLGGCLTEAGRLAEAEAPLRDGLAIVERAAGPQHAWTSYALRKLAESLAEQGRIAEALPLAERSLRQIRAESGADNARTADSLRVLGGLRFAAGDRRQGLALAKQALQALRDAHGLRHPQTALAALGLAALELRADMAQSAEARLRSVEAVFAANGDAPRALTSRMLRGAALTALGKPGEAETILRRALAERGRMYGATSARTAEAEILLGSCLARLGRRLEARRLLERGRSAFASQVASHHAVLDDADAEIVRLR